MKLQRHWFLRFLTIIVSFGICSGLSHAQQNGEVYRWDIQSRNFATTPPTDSPGGIASATADDGSKITLTGNGTFIIDQPPGLEGLNIGPRALGGGTWTIRSSSGAVTASGTYEVRDFISFHLAGATVGPTSPIDNIGISADRRAGLVFLRIKYSDGDRGVLVVGCHFPNTPEKDVFEGIAVSKGNKGFLVWEKDQPGVDANRAIFHILRP